MALSFPFEIFVQCTSESKGSGNIGATNVWRQGHKWTSLSFFLVDAAKGFLAIFFAYLWEPSLLSTLLAGLFVLLGHVFPLRPNVIGGKGMAVFFGILLFLVLSSCSWRHASLADDHLCHPPRFSCFFGDMHGSDMLYLAIPRAPNPLRHRTACLFGFMFSSSKLDSTFEK